MSSRQPLVAPPAPGGRGSDPDNGGAARIGIVDYGMGNRRSVEKALEHAGARVLISSDPAQLRELDGLVVPGVGAFPRAMERLRERGLDDAIREFVAFGKPVLGICLGMQIAFEHSSELGGAAGLGILHGGVRELRAGNLKLPQIGWNNVRWSQPSPLSAGIPDGSAFYHVHSFVCEPDQEAIVGSAEYGERFASVVASGSFVGVQFHPEKSSAHGLRLLANFTAAVAASRS